MDIQKSFGDGMAPQPFMRFNYPPPPKLDSPEPAGRHGPSAGVPRRARLSRLLAALAALLGASALAPAPAQAQVTLWSATLTLGPAQTDTLGCHRFADANADLCSARLAPNTVTVAGTSYTIRTFAILRSQAYPLTIDAVVNIERAAWTPLILRVDGRDFRVSQATGAADTGYSWNLNTEQQQWANGLTVGSQVSVSLIDPTQTTTTAPGPGGQRVQELPRGPLKLALWTDRSSYRPGQQLRLYRSLDPRRLRDEHAVLLYLQRVGSDQRTYLAPRADDDQPRSEPVDQFGRPEGAFRFRVPATVERQQTWQGPAPLQPGLWQFVMELHSRGDSVEPQRVWAKFMVGPGHLYNRRGFQREVTRELTLPGDRTHYLGDRLVVRPGATLRLQAGALLRAYGPSAEIVVEPGGRIVAEGTRQAPVVLTCSAPVGQRAPGCWGGLRIHGRAPVTGGEGDAAGGDAWDDSSGSLRYLRVEFAGASPQQDTAAPALALHGVGSGTLLQHVQVRSSAGDGIAFVGGTAVCEYCLASDSGAHGLSWQRGFRGSLRHLYVWQGSGDGDALHGRNLDSGPDRQPRSHPQLANVTLTAATDAAGRPGRGAGLRLQAGSALTATRLLVLGFSRSAALVADPHAGQLFEDGTSTVTDSIQHRNLRAHRGWSGAGVKFRTKTTLKLRNAGTDPNHDPRPKGSLEALADSDDEADYVGAFGEENWLEEWTVFGPESEYDPRERSEDEN